MWNNIWVISRQNRSPLHPPLLHLPSHPAKCSTKRKLCSSPHEISQTKERPPPLHQYILSQHSNYRQPNTSRPILPIKLHPYIKLAMRKIQASYSILHFYPICNWPKVVLSINMQWKTSWSVPCSIDMATVHHFQITLRTLPTSTCQESPRQSFKPDRFE